MAIIVTTDVTSRCIYEEYGESGEGDVEGD